MTLNFTTQIWKEGKTYVSYMPELDISSCGKTAEEAKANLEEAIKIFIKETKRMGTLDEILEEAGFIKKKGRVWRGPEFVSLEKGALAL